VRVGIDFVDETLVDGFHDDEGTVSGSLQIGRYVWQ
jgi:hypothetical protein